jgi:hypothetical protein
MSLQQTPSQSRARTATRTSIHDIAPVGRTLSADEMQLVAGAAPCRCSSSKVIDRINTGKPITYSDADF